MKVLAIDPGVTGALAWGDDTGMLERVAKIPLSILEFHDLMKEIKPDRVIMENVGFHRMGNSGSSSAKFGRVVGYCESLLVALHYPHDKVTPQQWMKRFLSGRVPKERAPRKRAIQAKVNLLRPDIHVTQETADAAGIYLWYTTMRGD